MSKINSERVQAFKKAILEVYRQTGLAIDEVDYDQWRIRPNTKQTERWIESLDASPVIRPAEPKRPRHTVQGIRDSMQLLIKPPAPKPDHVMVRLIGDDNGRPYDVATIQVPLRDPKEGARYPGIILWNDRYFTLTGFAVDDIPARYHEKTGLFVEQGCHTDEDPYLGHLEQDQRLGLPKEVAQTITIATDDSERIDIRQVGATQPDWHYVKKPTP